MAEPKGSGERKNRRKDDPENDPERTQRIPALQEPVDEFFSDDPGDRRGGGR